MVFACYIQLVAEVGDPLCDLAILENSCTGGACQVGL